MKKQALLILAASLVLPLTQCTDKSATTSNTEATASMVQQRTAAYSTLAAIPADVEAVISINHVGQIVQGLAANGIIPADQVNGDMTMWTAEPLPSAPRPWAHWRSFCPRLRISR